MLLSSTVSLEEFVDARRRWADRGLFARRPEDEFVTVDLVDCANGRRIAASDVCGADYPEIAHRFYEPAIAE